MDDALTRDARILVVDDEPTNIRLLERILQQAGFQHVRGVTDPRTVPDLYTQEQPDLILLDLHMPHMDGFAVLAALTPLIAPGTYVPILVLTSDITPTAKQRALSMGARDFLTKPFSHTEVLLRIKNLLETRWLHRQLANQNVVLEEQVRLRTQELEEARLEVLRRLALAAEYRDDDTGQHTQRVGQAAALLATCLGCTPDDIELIRRAAPLHDVGKIGIPDVILLKRGPLTEDEWTVMRQHTTIGAAILEGSHIPVLEVATRVALTHHERWDGSGYPRGLIREEIPLEGRILAIVDVYDALTHERPYKTAWSAADAAAELRRRSGSHFDPLAVNTFLTLLDTPRPDSV